MVKKYNLSGLDLVLYNKFRHLSNQQLVAKINSLHRRGLNDDDEVYELFRRKREQGLIIENGFDSYRLIAKPKQSSIDKQLHDIETELSTCRNTLRFEELQDEKTRLIRIKHPDW